MLMNPTRKCNSDSRFVVAHENDAYTLECYRGTKLLYITVFPDSFQAYQFGDKFLQHERLLEQQSSFRKK